MEIKEFLEEYYSPSQTVSAHTSGSTGKPKDIRLLKEDMRISARATNKFFGISRNSLLACPLSLDYIAGKMMLVRALEAGCRFMQLPVSNTVELPDDIEIDLLSVVPSQISSLLAQPRKLFKVKNILAGGARPETSQLLQLAHYGPKVYVSYGMTETCSHVAIAPAGTDLIYHAIPGVEFSCTADGRLEIDTPLSCGRLVTNDIVQLIDTKSFRWLGRADNVINSGGLKIHPEELEQAYSGAIGNLPFYLTSEAHDLWGEALVMVVEKNRYSVGELLKMLKERIDDRRLLPKRIVEIDRLPRTSSGKIKRLKPEELP